MTPEPTFSDNTPTIKPATLVIAGVHFTSTGPHQVAAAALGVSFAAFLQPAVADLACRVLGSGPDPELDAQPFAPEQPWAFTVCGDQCDLIRRNQAGAGLWRIRAPLTFEQATVSWSPRSFVAAYGGYEQAWGRGLGLTQLVFRLRRHGGLVLHGTAAELAGHGILCAGISGSGKSTLACLLDAAGATVLTDERPVIRQESPSSTPAAFCVHGSPWPSSAGFARRASSPLRRIYFLEHGDTDRLTPLTPQAAFNRLIHVATIPWQDPLLFDPCLATVEALLQAVPAAVLAFRPTPAVVDMLRQNLHD